MGIAWVGALIGLFGALAGVWNSYTIHFSEKFNRPITAQAAIAASFDRQIIRVEELGDEKEARRLREKHIESEKKFREALEVSTIINENIYRPSDQVSPTVKLALQNWINHIEKNPVEATVYDPAKLGDAWFLTDDYEKAVSSYETAVKENPYNSVNLLKRTRALGYWAANTKDHETQFDKYTSAVESAEEALGLIGDATWNIVAWSPDLVIPQEKPSTGQEAISIIQRNFNLDPSKVSENDKLIIENWIDSIENKSIGAGYVAYTHKALGDALFITNKYEKAATNYGIALEQNPYDSISLLKKTRALGYLAKSIKDPSLQSSKFASALSSAEKALILIEDGLVPPYPFVTEEIFKKYWNKTKQQNKDYNSSKIYMLPHMFQ